MMASTRMLFLAFREISPPNPVLSPTIMTNSAYDNETERFLKPIVAKQAEVAEKVQLHRKHLTVLLAAIQQMEAELDVDHQFTVLPSDV